MAQTDEEQVEELRKWWKKNGNQTLLGLIIGFGLFFGWRGWQQYEDFQAGQASYVYADVLNLLQDGKTELALKAAERLPAEFGSSSYVALGQLLQAKIHIDAAQTDKAEAVLKTAINTAALPEIKAIAQLRLARIQASVKKYTDAEATLASINNNNFDSLIQVAHGNIAYAQNKNEAAQKAYDIALNDPNLTGKVRDGAQMKRDAISHNEAVFSAKTVVPDIMYVEPEIIGSSNAASPLGLNIETQDADVVLQNAMASMLTQQK